MEHLNVPEKHIFQKMNGKRKSLSEQIGIKLPVESIRKLQRTEGVGSIYRETKHFSSELAVGRTCIFLLSAITTVNGPKRIFYAKGCARFFWIIVVFLVFALCIYQITVLVMNYFSKPTLSQVTYHLINSTF